MLRKHTFVGMADETLALLQHGTHLYLLNIANLSKDMFYQQVCLSIRSSAFVLPLDFVHTLPVRLCRHDRQSTLVRRGHSNLQHVSLCKGM